MWMQTRTWFVLVKNLLGNLDETRMAVAIKAPRIVESGSYALMTIRGYHIFKIENLNFRQVDS